MVYRDGSFLIQNLGKIDVHKQNSILKLPPVQFSYQEVKINCI